MAKKIFNIINIVIRGILVGLCLLLCAYNIYIIISRYALGNGMPTVFGYAGAEVVSGSMDDDSGADDIEIGDFVITKTQNDYVVGDVITFYYDGVYITHRIIGTYDGGYITRGDANDELSTERPGRDAVVGKVVHVIGGAGSVIRFINSPAGLLVVIAAGVIIWVASDILSGLLSRRKNEEIED